MRFFIRYVRMERQTGSIEIDAPDLIGAKLEAVNRAFAMRKGDYSGSPESWEADVSGHTIRIADVKQL